jgi:hypothetical protein
MIDTAAISVGLDSVEAVLREELARGQERAETLVPIMRHLLVNDSTSIFSDEVVAGVRGMMSDIVSQLLDRLAGPEVNGDNDDKRADEISELTGALVENFAFVEHLHALALEWQWTRRLQSKLGVDPVLSPLLQELIALQANATSVVAMKLLASQARFCQSQRRMQLSLFELPGDLLHAALIAMRTVAGTDPDTDERAAKAEAAVRREYDEATSRLGLLTRLVEGLGGGALAALSLSHAGPAMFLSALAIGSGQDRDKSVLSTDEGQAIRLALGLRAAGLKPKGVEEKMLSLHPDFILPEGFDRLNSDRAAAMLSLVSYRER